MAVNHADGMTFGSAIVCPILAMGSLREDTGWLTVPSVVAALPVCFAVLCIGRTLTYLVTAVGLRLIHQMKPWFQQIFIIPFCLVYFLLPVVAAIAAVCVTSFAAMQIFVLGSQVGGWIGFVTINVAAVVSAVATVAFWKRWFWLAPWLGVSA